jgi:hypothetical protein
MGNLSSDCHFWGTKKIQNLVVSSLLLFFLVLSFMSIREKSLTTDEYSHLAMVYKFLMEMQLIIQTRR